MIIVTRLNGPAFALNPDLIERAEATPDTVITLVDGTKYVVAEPLEQLITLIRNYRASVISAANAHDFSDFHAQPPERATAEGRAMSVVPLHPREQ